MKFKGLAVLALALLVVGGFAFEASASACRNPGSLLLFPYFDTDGQNLSVITITNTGPDDVVLRIVWVYREKWGSGQYHCVPADTWIELTRNDTFTFFDKDLFFEDEEGFSYVYAVDDFFSDAEIDYDYLIGQEILFQSEPGDDPKYLINASINAVSFEALNVNGDGLLKLDGVEYSLAPSKLLFPRFFGQPDLENPEVKAFESWLVFVNLTGGKFYNVTAKSLIFNDNEIGFSRTFQFPCWDVIKLNELSGVFENSFLVKTDHDLYEPLGFEKLVETGWFYLYGQQAWYDTNFINDPSIYAVLVETIGLVYGAADLPFQLEDPKFNKGSLYPTTVNP